MRLRQISIEGLFDLYNYNIPLNTDERVTIIIAPNGYGKTTIFKLIKAAIDVDIAYIRKIPFKVFKIEFEKENSFEKTEKICTLEIIKQISIDSNDNISYESITCKITKSNGVCNQYPLRLDKEAISDFELRYFTRIVERETPLERITYNKWKDLNSGEILDVSDLIKVYGHLLPRLYSHFSEYYKLKDKLKEISEYYKLNDELKEISEYYKLKDELKEIKVHLIESQRLMKYDPQKEYQVYGSHKKKIGPIPAVLEYSTNLIKLIENKNSEYANISQKRDSTFPHRLIQNVGSDAVEILDEKEIYKRIQEIETKNKTLMELGILESREFSDLPQESMTSERRRVLTLYIEDAEIKLSVFDDLEKKMSLFKEIIDMHFSNTNKSIEVGKSKGFVFKLKNGEVLTPEKLSSGEQHEVIINYELLFETSENSIILIDEPEISLHITWQEDFIKNLLKIAELNKLNIIIATHSPQIIDDRWDLTVDLEEGEGQ